MDASGVLALASGLLAQAVKVLVELLRRRRLEPSLALSTGGMPSSHTATVTTLAAFIGERQGLDSPLFSLAVIFGIYVVFEATGLRQEVGFQARLLNELVDEVVATRHVDRRRLKELIGHTWLQVAGGFAFGLGFYLVVRRWVG